MIEQIDDEELVRAARKRRAEAMRKEKQKQMMRRQFIKKLMPFVAAAFVLCIFLVGGIRLFHGKNVENRPQKNDTESVDGTGSLSEGSAAGKESYGLEDAPGQSGGANPMTGDGAGEVQDEILSANGTNVKNPYASNTSKTYQASETAATKQLGAYLNSGDELHSGYALLIDWDKDEIIAEKYANTRINPASMTKILTVLVAAEHVQNLDDTFTMTLDITDYGYVHDCSSAGFVDQEQITVRDLFYGTILPSGADAAVGLAVYTAGSQEAFVEMMNEKLKELGLSDTAHFTNCVGIYDKDHYCTVYDMAMILEAAVDNELCREVLSAHIYTTSRTPQHPEGIELSNWFLRRIEDKDSGGDVLCAKTGYVVQSGNCAASYATDSSGKRYICVTADGNSSWGCIYDHARIYKQFLAG